MNRRDSQRIGIIHYKTGDTDGVSLEMEKWRLVLEALGRTVFFCSGGHGREPNGRAIPGSDAGTVTVIPALHHQTFRSERLTKETFTALENNRSESDYRDDILAEAADIAREVGAWITRKRIQILIVENIWSVALNLGAAIGIWEAVRRHHLRIIAHHHDFYWERADAQRTSCGEASEIIDRYFPPSDPGIIHITISSLARRTLLARKGLNSTVIPNVFDFSRPWERDRFNEGFRQDFGLAPSDIMVLQATRIIPRKGIELAIRFVGTLNRHRDAWIGRQLWNGQVFTEDSRVVLVLAGYERDDATGTYLNRLRNLAVDLGVDMIPVGDRIAFERAESSGVKTYALWDAYVHADLATYPSLWEGWGNQLLEAVQADLPLVLFSYPVYEADISPLGFRFISLGAAVDGYDGNGLAIIGSDTLEKAAGQSIPAVFDRQARRSMVEWNKRIARDRVSLEALRIHLRAILDS